MREKGAGPSAPGVKEARPSPPWEERGGAWENSAGPPGPSAPLNKRRRARRRRRDPGARAGACPPASRRGKCIVGEGRRSVGKDGRCIGGGLAAGGCAGGGRTGRGLNVTERMGVGLSWGVSAGEGHVWIRGGWARPGGGRLRGRWGASLGLRGAPIPDSCM